MEQVWRITVFLPVGWPRRESALYNYLTGAGIIMAPIPKEDIRDGLTRKCATMDKPISALIKDLKERGLFDETLIIIGGEFGRTPFREGRTSKGKVLGRDHFPDCYTMIMAGGGVKGGHVHGESDDLGFSVTKDPVHVQTSRLPGCTSLI